MCEIKRMSALGVRKGTLLNRIIVLPKLLSTQFNAIRSNEYIFCRCIKFAFKNAIQSGRMIYYEPRSLIQIMEKYKWVFTTRANSCRRPEFVYKSKMGVRKSIDWETKNAIISPMAERIQGSLVAALSPLCEMIRICVEQKPAKSFPNQRNQRVFLVAFSISRNRGKLTNFRAQRQKLKYR